ncbi:MAG: 5-amino-6-(D-ribitylamino)uracil--L-tyrosine 4-hydroxyphenyl transferase CofH [Pirellulales bacterium]|nr:5-amino-6-(D-ribitylamino)uracil--L-tyrosine 4-hydroxyphenyl transferase CofH [Pirellulales bacterium]
MAKLEQILDKPFRGKLLTRADAVTLLTAPDEALPEIFDAADRLNRQVNGDRVSYVYNRNINFTNICGARCAFCAYWASPDDAGAYCMTPDEVAQVALQSPGVDEVCMQGGLNPAIDFQYLLDVTRAVHQALPHAHIHAFSPMEIEFHTRRAGLPLERAFERLIEAGFGSLCGTAAEILVDDVRRDICPAKLSADRWFEVVGTAHRMGLRSTSTMLFGHIESPANIAEHIGRLRDLQQQTGGLTEFIPLIFIPYRTRLGRERGIHEMLPVERTKLLYATSRLFFAPVLPNVQTSWCKLGLPTALETLDTGCNDLGGTLLSENITRTAGGRHGQAMTVEALVAAIRSAGRTPVHRDTLYNVLSVNDRAARRPA